VRKQRVVLEHVSAIPALRAQVYLGGGVVKNLVVEQNASGIRRDKARNAVERQSLTRAAGSEQHGDAGGGPQFHIELEAGRFRTRGEALADARLDHPAGCLRSSQLVRYRIAIATAEVASTSARASAPLPDSTAS